MRQICWPMQKSTLCVAKGQHENRGVGQAQPKVVPKQDQLPVVKCKICGKPNPTYKCWHNPDNKSVASSAEFNSQYIEILVALTSAGIIMTIITGPTIWSIFVKLIIKIWM